MTRSLADPVPLPCGVVLPNRIAKAPMTEGLAEARDDATPALARLYGRWADAGAGHLPTGNVMIDRRYLERAGNVVVDGASKAAALRAWAEAGTRRGVHLWAQLSPPGRQCTRFHTGRPVAPSSSARERTSGAIAGGARSSEPDLRLRPAAALARLIAREAVAGPRRRVGRAIDAL